MANLTEVKANAFYFLAREVGERLTAPIGLVIDESVTKDRIKKSKDFRDLAQGYYSLFILSEFPEEKIESLTELAQQLINLGHFKQARQLLDQHFDRLIVEVPLQGRRLLLKAQATQKYGWIADYEGGFSDSINYFLKSRDLIEQIPRERWGKAEQDYYSTSTHFLGRGYFGLALQGISREANARSAITYFEQDLDRFRDLRIKGEPVPAHEAFQHAWLARCHFLLNELDVASWEVEETGRLFEEFVHNNAESGVMAHYHLLKGRLRLFQGLPDLAVEEFSEALRIREELEYYPKGYADAAIGLALSHLRKADLVNSVRFTLKAVKAYPLILARGVFGG